jgi:hypothetical protein
MSSELGVFLVKRKHMTWIILAALIISVVVFAYMEIFLRPHSTYVVYEGYFKCESRKSLEGGIYGKGPLKEFGPRYCRGWVMIDRKEFKQLATKWCGVNWQHEIDWWQKP